MGTAARFNFPTGVAVNNAGDVYLADASNHTIRLCFVLTAPSITTQPQSRTATVGENVTLSVIVAGKPAPTCQWFFNGVMIGGATSDTLVISNVQSANAGNYTVAVTNSAGTATSSQATLTVNPASGGSTGASSSRGGGGGALSPWFYGALLLLAAARRKFRRQK